MRSRYSYSRDLSPEDIRTIKRHSDHFQDGEHIDEVATQLRAFAHDSNTIAPWVLFCTDRRLLVLQYGIARKVLFDYEYERITNSYVRTGVRGGTVYISVPGAGQSQKNTYALIQGIPKKKADRINKYIRSRLSYPKDKFTFRSGDINEPKKFAYYQGGDTRDPNDIKDINLNQIVDHGIFDFGFGNNNTSANATSPKKYWYEQNTKQWLIYDTFTQRIAYQDGFVKKFFDNYTYPLNINESNLNGGRAYIYFQSKRTYIDSDGRIYTVD